MRLSFIFFFSSQTKISSSSFHLHLLLPFTLLLTLPSLPLPVFLYFIFHILDLAGPYLEVYLTVPFFISSFLSFLLHFTRPSVRCWHPRRAIRRSITSPKDLRLSFIQVLASIRPVEIFSH